MHLRAGDAHGGVVVAEGAFYARGGGGDGDEAWGVGHSACLGCLGECGKERGGENGAYPQGVAS